MINSKANGRRLAGTMGAVAAGLGGAQSLDAAVVAQSVDAGIPPNFSIDLNGDAVREFEIADYSEGSVENTLKVSSFPAGGGVNLAVDGDNFVANLPQGTLIGPSSGLTFAQPPGATDDLAGVKNDQPVGNFQVDDPAGYIGVEFTIDTATHYGYVGFQGVETDGANEGPEGRVYGFGYESDPNTPIAAGAGLAPALTADVDMDGDVDGADFLAIQRGQGTEFDQDDVTAFREQFGQGGAPAGVTASATPEPGSLALLAAGAAGITLYRRGRGR